MSKTLPIVPMRNTVLFPGASLPITAGRPQTLKAIEAAMRDPEHLVFAVVQREDGDEIDPDNLYTMGTIATISSVQRGLGGVRLVLNGRDRANAIKISQVDGHLVATVQPAVEIAALDAKDSTFQALHREVRARSAELAKERGLPDEAVEQMMAQIREPGELTDLVAAYLDVPVADRQELLEMLAVEDRLRRVLVLVQKQIDVL